MGILLTLQAAFANKALTFAQTNNLPIYFENTKYAPTVGTKHLRAFYIPNSSSAAGCGEVALNRQKGIYAINIYSPKEVGVSIAYPLADLLITEFKRGTKITKNGIELTITRATIDTYDENESWYILPVSISFYAYTPNQ